MNKLIILFVILSGILCEVPSTPKNVDYIDVIKCLLNNESLINDVHELLDAIRVGDFLKLITMAPQLYTDGSRALKECLTPKAFISNDLDPTRRQCRLNCFKYYGNNHILLHECLNNCK